MTQGLDNLTINSEETSTVDAINLPAERKAGTALAQYHGDFEGLGESDYPSRVTLDGNQILYKDEDQALSEIRIFLKGGRKVKQIFLEDSQTYIKSYNGVTTEDGNPVGDYKGWREMYELDWTEEREGEIKQYQMVLSPTSKYAFEEFATALKSVVNKKLTEVEIIVTAVRSQNKDGQRYSKAAFTCQELIDKGWKPKERK